ncbi:hypothetical protein GF385_00475 [Candidatus Dependentiae bacterium]|nr:hypothetical protein [Candidatus Dependentiae bacterium]
MGFVQKKMNKIIDFGFSLAPLLILVFTYKITKSWKLAFYLSAPFAIISLIKAFTFKSKEIFLLAVNCFLSIGLFMFLFNIGWLQKFYEEFLYSMIFVWVFVISLILTFFTKDKIFDSVITNKRKVFNYSLYFLTATVIALGFSFYFRTDYFLGAWLPFVILLVLKDFFNTFIKGVSFAKFYLLGGELIIILIAAMLRKHIFVSLLFLIIGRRILHLFWEKRFGKVV